MNNNASERNNLILKICVAAVIVIAVVTVIILGVTTKQQPYDNIDTKYCGRYDLTSIDGLYDKYGNKITIASYDYNYIELKEDGRYVISNKYGKTKTDEEGIWHVEGTTLYTETSKWFGLIKSSLNGEITENTITFTIERDGSKVVMVMTKSN